MRGSTVIKWAHRLTTAILLVLVIGFLVLNHMPDPRDEDELIRSYKVSEHSWLYVTRYSGGGATTPIVFRYYLTDELPGSDAEKLKSLMDSYPFIVGTGSISEIHANDDGTTDVTYSGKVFSTGGNIERLQLKIRDE